MNRARILMCVTILLLNACSNGGVSDTTESSEPEEAKLSTNAPKVNFEPDASTMMTSKLQGPVQISYRIIGQPVVGQPVAIDLQFESALKSQSFNVSYRINDTTAMHLKEAQPARVKISPSAGEKFSAQQVTVIPMREGRLYLNVAAEIETDTGSMSSVTAIPIQVGLAPRELSENGVVTTDEHGELIRTLPAKED